MEKSIAILDNKTDLYGDHKGSWQGLKKPTMSDEGMRATVEKINEVDIPKLTGDIENITSIEFPKFDEKIEEVGQIIENINTTTIPEIKEEIKEISLNVKSFGAIGDGVADDTEAIQQAFDSGDIIYFPQGQYLITKPIDLKSEVKSVKGEKTLSVLKVDEYVPVLFKNVSNYSNFSSFRVHVTNDVFKGSMNYCTFEKVDIRGNKSKTIVFEDIQENWCGFVHFKECMFSDVNGVFYFNGSANYLTFDSCTFQKYKGVLVTDQSQVVSFNHCDFEFGQEGSILLSPKGTISIHHSPCFSNCYMENIKIIDESITNLQGSPAGRQNFHELTIKDSWIYNDLPLVKSTVASGSITFTNNTVTYRNSSTKLFILNGDISLFVKGGYGSTRYYNNGRYDTASIASLIEGTSRNKFLLVPQYNRWEVLSDIKFNKGIILGDSFPDNDMKGSICYQDDVFKLSVNANSIPMILPTFRAGTLADLKNISNITGFALGTTNDTKELYFYTGSAWRKINMS